MLNIQEGKEEGETDRKGRKTKLSFAVLTGVCDVEDASMHTSAADVCTLPAKENRMRSTAKGGGQSLLGLGSGRHELSG